jgi:hypothetical protein
MGIANIAKIENARAASACRMVPILSRVPKIAPGMLAMLAILAMLAM